MPNAFLDYFRTSKEELEKVSWPSKNDTIRYSTLIIVGSVAAALFFGALDLGLGRLVQLVIGSKTSAVASQPVTPTTQPVPIDPSQIQATDQNGNPLDIKVQQAPTTP